MEIIEAKTKIIRRKKSKMKLLQQKFVNIDAEPEKHTHIRIVISKIVLNLFDMEGHTKQIYDNTFLLLYIISLK